MVSRSQITTTLNVLAASSLQQKHVLLWQALDQKKEVECLATIAIPRQSDYPTGDSGFYFTARSPPIVADFGEGQGELLNRVMKHRQKWEALRVLYTDATGFALQPFHIAFAPGGQGWKHLHPSAWNGDGQLFSNYVHRHTGNPYNLGDNLIPQQGEQAEGNAEGENANAGQPGGVHVEEI